MWLQDRQAGQGTKFTEIQRKSIKNRMRAGAAGHALAWALLLSLPQSDERAKRLTKKKEVVIVGEGKVPDSLD